MVSPGPLPTAHLHPSPLKTLAPHLLTLLPHSLPLLRRIQFPHSSPNANVFATFPPSTPPPSPTPSTFTSTLSSATSQPNLPAPPPFPFAATHADRTRAPETECWLFSTYELHPSHRNFTPFPTSTSPAPIDYSLRSTPEAEEARLHVLAVLDAIAGLSPPSSLPLPQAASSNHDPQNPAQEILVLGTLHESLISLLTSPLDHLPAQRVLSRSPRSTSSSASPFTDTRSEGVLSGVGEPTFKWLIPPPLSSSSAAAALPPGYELDTLTREDIKVCVSRTDIPRREEQLVKLRNACVRYRGETKKEEEGGLVAWALLGVDGSLTSLHTELAHRGKGLARHVVGGLMGRGICNTREDKGVDMDMGEWEGWITSDVYWDNTGGHGVARGLGGKEGWVNRWVGCDLGRCREVWRRLKEERERERSSKIRDGDPGRQGRA